jgi:hypothetical protein
VPQHLEVPVLETPFRAVARGLKSPTAQNFDPAQWQEAFAQVVVPSPADRKLLESALWIGREVAALNERSVSLFGTLCAEQAIALGIALVNREFWTSADSTKREIANLPLEKPASFDHMANLRYENIYGQKMSAADFVENGIEALSSWIFDARRICPSMRRVLKGLFDGALHLGTTLDQNGNCWRPQDRKFDELRKAWQARAESNLMDNPQLLAVQWPHLNSSQRRARALPRSVSEVRWSANGWVGKVRRMEYLSKRPRGYPLERRALESSYLGLFLDEDLPLAPGLTVSILHRAWWVISDLTNLIEKSARRSERHSDQR